MSIVNDKDKLFRAIGRVVVEFQFIESTLSEILASLLKLQESNDKYRIAAAMSFRQKVDLMCDLYDSRKNPKWASVDIFVTRKALNTAEEFRNRVLHSFWHFDSSKLGWVQTKPNLRGKTGLKIDTRVVSIENLEIGAKSLYVVRDWYLGQSDKITLATNELKSISTQLNLLENLDTNSE